MKNLTYVLFALFIIAGVSTAAFSIDTCVDCHKEQKFRVQDKSLFDYYKKWEGSEHDEAGVSCKDCHGGDETMAKKEDAHGKDISPYKETSMVFFKNIPKTCGKCHEGVYKNFTDSKHYKALEQSGRGPVCITCHGNPLASVYYTSTVLSTCRGCHNLQTGNNPGVIDVAENILHRMNLSRGLLKWTSRHFEDMHEPEKFNKVESLYQNISTSWHRFDLTNTDKDSEELLTELRAIFREVRESGKKNDQ